MVMPMYKDADNLVVWDRMIDLYDNTFVNDATVVFTLKDADHVAVTGASAIAMPYVGNSNGKYAGVLDASVDLVIGTRYFLEITATSGQRNGFRRFPVLCHYRGQ